MKKTDKSKASHYRARGEKFIKGIKHLAEKDLAEIGDAVALLAVHSAISFADAVLVHYGGERSSGDHKAVITALNKLCADRGVRTDGSKHLKWLVARKDDIAYGDRRLDVNSDVKKARDEAEKFRQWIYATFKEFSRAGDD